MNRLRKGLKKLYRTVKAWPLATKVAVPLSVIFMLAGATLMAMLLHEDLAVTAEADTETEAASELYMTEIETETETETGGLEVIAALPEYTSVSMIAESIEKDLTVYLEDENNENITGVAFRVKLITEEQLSELQELVDAIADTDVTEYEPPVGYEEMTLTEEELQALKKQEAISAYAAALAAVDGEVLTDDDEDGIIYADDLTAGDYVLMFVPILQYDASEYAMDVTVKDKVEYTAVTTIQKKVVTYDASEDPQATTNTQVEEVEEDTVSEVASSSVTSQVSYSTAVTMDLGIAASVSDEVNSTTNSCELTDTGGSYDTGSTSVVSSTLTLSKTLTLYANAQACSATVVYTASNVTELQMTASSEISSYLTITSGSGGYTVKITEPTSVAEDLSGTLTLSGEDASGNAIQVTCAVTIIGADTLLTDADGNQLYYQDSSGNMLRATVGTYTSSTKYCYIVSGGETTYYGWQTIDGKTYYYDETGTAVTGKQTISGVTYYFASDGSLITEGFGIDVSKWQGTIDWSQASTAVSFAIIRCGLRYSSSRTLAEDPMYLTNITQAKKYGVNVGIYFYSTALTEAQAVEEASLAISLADQAGGLDLPIFIDMEDSVQTSLTTAQRDAIVQAFCKTVINSGYSAGVYANKNWLTNYLTPSKYSDYMIWCAQYNTSCTYSGRYEIWQYSQSGTIPGISGSVDLNHGYF